MRCDSSDVADLQPHDEWTRDPDAYVQGVVAFADTFEAREDEANAIGWLAQSVTGDTDDDLVVRLVGLGYIAAAFEDWNEDALSEPIGLTANFRAKNERAWKAKGLHPEVYDLVWASNIFRTRIAKSVTEGDSTQDERLATAFGALVVPMFDERPVDANLRNMRVTFNLGIGLRLAFLWSARMDGLGFGDEERWADLEVASDLMGGDRLEGLALPISIHGCLLTLADGFGYEIRSEGPFGGQHITSFLAAGAEADITSIIKTGRVGGTRPMRNPLPRHVDVLRDLGFQTACFPSGQRYVLSSHEGLSGIRPID